MYVILGRAKPKRQKVGRPFFRNVGQRQQVSGCPGFPQEPRQYLALDLTHVFS